MAPVKPLTKTVGQNTVEAFNGAIISTLITHPSSPTRAFAFHITFHNHHSILLSLSQTKPPLHFHPHQDEFMEVLSGSIIVELNGSVKKLTPADGEFCVKKWSHHRLWPCIDEFETTEFLLSGAETQRKEDYRADAVFFQNWYGYQDQVILKKEKIDLIQVMSMFDAGGSYLSLPWWVPFGRWLSLVLSILIGRWIGGILGYQPFHREWTNDWDMACDKMEQSFFQRKFAMK